ncbi:MAG: NAD(P)-binding protein [Sulfuriferula sp.]|nr:NAD(P)-binding protein [Sulfuriferula sp.]
MTQRPQYIYTGGSALMHSPLQLQQANMYGFFLKGGLAQLQATVDTALNQVAAGRMLFKVLSPYVMTTFTRVGHANSTVPVDKDKGWITEVDIVTWIMVGKMDEAGKLSYVYWYPCHIFVDDGMALINGRELFGYPKYLCEYEIPEVGADPLRCAVSAKGFQPFSPDTQIAMHPLLEVNAVKKINPHRPVKDFLDFLMQAFELLKSMPDFLNMDIAGWADVISLLFKPRTDQIFLKQFPDSAGEKAVYQAIVAAPANVDKLHSGALLGYEYTATLHPFASFPLDQTLGLPLGDSPAILPFNLQFDFTVTPGEELVDNSQIQPEKIAILGGGVGAMTTAHYLTSQPGWQNKYDITVYQMGWRIGGKGASGRNAQYGQRIEEHGLHIWFGFYENAFATIKEAYAAMNRPAGAPLATWQDAFKPHNFVALSEDIDDEWKMWLLDFPELPGVPGDGSETITLWQAAVALLGWIRKWLGDIRDVHLPDAGLSSAGEHPDWLHALASAVGQDVNRLGADISEFTLGLHLFVTALPEILPEHTPLQRTLLASSMKGVKQWQDKTVLPLLDGNDELRRLYICVDLGVTVMLGMLEDGVFEQGFDVINNLDFRAWLTKHGANVPLVVNSAPVRGFYDLVFAYEGGDFSKPNAEAGTLLRAMMRIGLCYKGGLMYKMQAGMGDTIFTPFYQVLKARGVKFQFFHKVEELVPDGDTVGEIRLTRQVAVAAGSDSYDPLVYVKGLACWPSTPNFDQIMPQQAALLQAQNVNLESNWSNWPALYEQTFGEPLPQVSLKKGRDFDRVVFGISIGALPQLCPQLLAQSPALKATAENVQTVVTQAYQIWQNQDIAQLGWTAQPEGQEPVLSGFTEPYDTWAPMDQLLCREDWPAPLDPKNVSYFCSAMPVDVFPPITDYGFPGRCADIAKQGAIDQLNQSITALLPNAGVPGAYNWNNLVDPAAAIGVARFDSQYWRANVDPSERYVLSVVNSTQYRLATDGSGFSNLYLTGDWIKTGLNAGCVEAAVMAGMQASRAMTGYPRVIKGETDF